MKKMLKTVLFVVTAIFSTAIFAETDACDKPASLNTRTVDDVTYYEIGTCGDLYKFAEMVSGGETTINGMLIDDIVVNANVLKQEDGSSNVDETGIYIGDKPEHLWIPMGTESAPYKGTFDGNGHVISGLYWNDPDMDGVGFIGFLRDGLVEGMGIVDSYFRGYAVVGGVIGYNDRGSITKVYNAGSVYGSRNVGGVIGYNYCGSITKVYNTGYVYAYLAGSADNRVECIAGVVGQSYQGSFDDVHNEGVVASDGSWVSGVVSTAYQTTINNAYNEGTVIGAEVVGGVVAESYAVIITNVYNTGSVDSKDGGVGGVVGYAGEGYAGEDGNIINAYNAGSVHSGGDYAGGIVGYLNYASITNVYNAGSVNSDKNYVGGVVGYSEKGTISNSYFSTDNFSGNVVGYNQDGSIDDNSMGMATAELASLDVANAFDNSEGVWIAGEETRSGGWLTYTFPSLKNVGTALKNVLLDPGASEVEISNAEDLFRFAKFVNGGETSINAKLTADICVNACDEGERVLNDDGTLNVADSSKFIKWTPIGTDAYPFAGTFDGDEHTISGLYFNDASVNDVGLFGKVLAATIQNVGIEDSYINGGEGVGALAGTIASGSRVSDVYNAGSVSGKMMVGGIIGKVEGSEVSDAHNAGAVTTEEYSAGGVVGDVVKSTIANAYNTGDVSGPEWIGGVVGSGSGFTVSQVYNAGEISGSQAVGGLVGTFTSKSSLRNAYNIGKVSGDDRVGGVFGYVYEGAIVYVYSKGEVIAEKNGGGLIGFFDSGTIDSSYFDEAIYAGEAVGINKYGLGITGTEVLGKTSDELVAGTSLKLDTAAWVVGGVGVGTTNDSLYYPYLKVFGPHEYVLSDVKKYSITVAVNDEIMGTVTGAGEYEYGAKVEISATAKKGYKFVKWSDGVKDAKRAITVTKAEKLTATFEKDSKKDAVVAMAQLPQFSVTASGKMVSIAGVRPNTNVVVYDLQGNMVKTIVATSANFTFALPSAGVYIVKNGYTAKRVNVR